MKRHVIKVALAVWLVLSVTSRLVQPAVADESEQGKTAKQTSDVVNLRATITGNREQPKVLYIVPWKAVNDSDLADHAIERQLEVVFDHVEAAELRRELQYLKTLSD